MKKIIVFAGSFNPPTIAHLTLGKEIAKRIEDVEMVVYSPVNDGYRKKGLISGIYRLEMTKLLTKNEDKLTVSDIEVKNSIYMSTYDSLKAIQKEYPKRDIYLMMGSDKLGQLRKWRNVKQLLTDFRILLISRDNAGKMELLDEHPTFHEFKNRFEIMESMKEIDISSTMIRQNIKEGKNIEDLTKLNVSEYIKEKKLYL